MTPLTPLPLLVRARAVFVILNKVYNIGMENAEKKRVAILIDGGNFYKKIRRDGLVPKGTRFDYVKFAKFLANGRPIASKAYYI